MIFYGKKTCIGVIVLLICTAFVGVQSGTRAAGEPPIADAGGPYYGDECMGLFFDGSGSYDTDGESLVYRWFIDGSWTEPSAMPYSDYTWLDDYSGEITLEVSDGDNISLDTALVFVSNLNPYIMSTSPSSITMQVANEVTISVDFFDGDPRNNMMSMDPITATFVWGDGESSEYLLDAGERNAKGTHVYNNPGSYTVEIELSDDDGGTAQSSASVVIEGGGDTPKGEERPWLNRLYTFVDELNIPRSLKRRLHTQLDRIQRLLDDDRFIAAANKLNAFLEQIKAQRGKKINFRDARNLIDEVRTGIRELRIKY